MATKTTGDRLGDAVKHAEALIFELMALKTEIEALREQAPELVGPGEIAEMLGIHPANISRMRKAGRIPAPIQELKDGPVWLKAQFTFPNTLGSE